MRYRLLIIPAIVAILLLAACQSMPREVMQFDTDAFGRRDTIEMNSEAAPGDTVRVMLGSNPSTGYAWGEPDISNEAVIELKGEPEYIQPDEAYPGAAGFEQFEFKAKEKGECRVELEYGQPWEGGEKGTWKFILNVTVE